MKLGYTYIEVDERLNSRPAPTLLSVSQYFGVVPRSFISDDEPRADNFEKYKVCREGDLVLNRFNAYRGSLGLSKELGIVSPDYLVLRPAKKWVSSYLNYLLRSDPVANYMKQHMGGIGAGDPDTSGFSRISAKALARYEMELVPRLEEQHQIVNFLDRETNKIDALIDKQEQLIATLREDRAATITQAVTKGLDPSTSLRESGSTWLGAIPFDWTACQLGRLCRSISDGPHFSPAYVDARDGVMFLSARNIRVDGWSLSDAKYISEEDYAEFSKRVVPEVGDVLYTKGGTTGVARAVDIEERFQVWVHVAVLKVRTGLINPEFLAYALNSQPCYEQSQLYTRGATNKDLGLTRMIRITLALPPISQQAKICKFLDDRCSKIDALISKSIEMIETLREYRSALITNAVTGKIDVREAV